MAVDDDNNPAIELGAPIAPWSAADLGVEPGLALYEAAFLIGGTSRLVAVTLARLVARGVLVRSDDGQRRFLRLAADALDGDDVLAPIERTIARAADGFDINAAALVDVVAHDPHVHELRDRLAARGFVHVSLGSREQIAAVVAGGAAVPSVSLVLWGSGIVNAGTAFLLGNFGLLGGMLIAGVAFARPVHRAYRKSVAAIEQMRAHSTLRDAELTRFLAPLRSPRAELQLIVDVAGL